LLLFPFSPLLFWNLSFEGACIRARKAVLAKAQKARASLAPLVRHAPKKQPKACQKTPAELR
jgi:hypothetical protein